MTFYTMAKYTFEMSWNYSEEEYNEFLKEHSITHLKSHSDNCFKVGDALRSNKGVIARIMEKFNNYENSSHDYTIASNKLSIEEIYKHFGNYTIQGNINHTLNNQLDLRYVSPEVGWVDQDEEYY